MILDQAIAIGFIVATVQALRTKWPKIDGFLVLLTAAVVGVGLSFLDEGSATIRATILRGILWGGAGSGFMHVAKTIAGTESPGDDPPAKMFPNSIPPLAPPPPRGFARVTPMLALAVGCVPLALLLYCLSARSLPKPGSAIVMGPESCVNLHDPETGQDVCATEDELAPLVPVILQARR